MIQVFGIRRDGRFVAGVETTPERDDDGVLTAEYELAWFDLISPTPEDLAFLARRFHFHPLAIEDCAHFDQRPKYEEYADHLFVVLHGLRRCPEHRVAVYELHCFLARDAVVTVAAEDIVALRGLRTKISRDRGAMPTQIDFMLHKILDAVMDANPAALQELEDEIDELDDAVLRRHRGSAAIERIHSYLRQLNQVRHVLNPQKDIFQSLLNGEYPAIGEKARVYFRDVFDHLVHLTHSVETLRETLWAIRDAHLAVAAFRTNEAMKRLTVFSVIFLPLTFITGFFGMNFEHIPWRNDHLFYMLVGLISIIPIGMMIWFRRKDWL
jgi:magnesium transporter